jgi:FkbM family methyltransferase
MIAPMHRWEQLRPLAQAAGKLAVPVGLAEALEARRTFERRGLGPAPLRTYRQAWLSRLHLLPVDLDFTAGVVVDVGANEGNFSNAVLALAPRAQVIAVEPSPGPRARLEARLGDHPGLTIVGSALAAATGTATLHVTGHDHNTSLHAPREEMQTLYEDPGWSVVEDIEVPTSTLDDLVGDRDVAALKLDVQGGELEVLSGGARTLARTRAVLLEVTFVSHYVGDATFPHLDATMREHGFELIAMSEPGRNDEGVVTWADACYARRSA